MQRIDEHEDEAKHSNHHQNKNSSGSDSQTEKSSSSSVSKSDSSGAHKKKGKKKRGGDSHPQGKSTLGGASEFTSNKLAALRKSKAEKEDNRLLEPEMQQNILGGRRRSRLDERLDELLGPQRAGQLKPPGLIKLGGGSMIKLHMNNLVEASLKTKENEEMIKDFRRRSF